MDSNSRTTEQYRLGLGDVVSSEPTYFAGRRRETEDSDAEQLPLIPGQHSRSKFYKSPRLSCCIDFLEGLERRTE